MTTKKGHIPVYNFVTWDDAPTEMLAEYVDASHRGFGAHPVPGFGDEPKNIRKDVENMPQVFIEHCDQVMREMGYEASRWRYWVSKISEEPNKAPNEQWAQGFPHNHGWEGLTFVHYLKVPPRGGALVIRDWERKEIARFQPEVGMTAVIDGRTEHGVERVYDGERWTCIATGYIE